MTSELKISVIQTSRDTNDRLTKKDAVTMAFDEHDTENQLLNLYPDVFYQEIEGFGGAFTEAGGVTLAKLSGSTRHEVLHSYFSPDSGLGYSLCRTHMNSCDFSLGNYSYVENEDTSLDSFDISRDKEALLPFIQSAINVDGASFKLLASPWSPPAWMKTNQQMNKGGKLLPTFQEVWARYYAKYINAYIGEGVSIWAITVQNEPKAVQRWDSCIYSGEEEKSFVKNYLGPTLKREGLSEIKIIVWDHNKERVYERACEVFQDPEAAKYIWGVGFHWYSGDHFGGLDAVNRRFPDKKLLFTEGCVENGVRLGDWSSGERYGHQIMGDLNHWCSGWIDWNMLLDETGGPNHAGNFCDAPIIADWKNDTLHFQSSFYYIGHFSKYIRPGARRIGHSVYTDAIECTAFQNVNGELVTVVMNRSDKPVPFKLRHGGMIAPLAIGAHTIQTLIVEHP